MADTANTAKSGKIVQVTYSDLGADWNYSDDGGFLTSMWVTDIIWLPSAQNDVLVINEGSIDGASIIHATNGAATVTEHHFRLGGRNGVQIHPYIDLSDCTFGTIANIKIIFILA